MKKDILDDNLGEATGGGFLLRDEKTMRAEERIIKITPFSILFFFCFDWMLFKENNSQLIFWGVLFSLGVAIPLLLVQRWRKIISTIDVNDEQDNPLSSLGFLLHQMLSFITAFGIFAPGLDLTFHSLTYLELFFGLCLSIIGAIYMHFLMQTSSQIAKLKDYREELRKKHRRY